MWDATYHNLMSLLISSIDKKHQEMIKTIINPKTVYEKLNAQYEKENYQQLLINTTDLFMVNTLKNKEVDVKIIKLKSLNTQVRTYNKILKLLEK